MSTGPPSTATAMPPLLRIGNGVALLTILLLGCAGVTLIALPRSVSNISILTGPPLDNSPAAAGGESPQVELGEMIAVAEAYYTDHHTYRGITRRDLRHYGVDPAYPPARIYFATKSRYCVETYMGVRAWSRNGPFAPAQPHLCGRLALAASPAPHDGRQPDLPLLPHQATIPIGPAPDFAIQLPALNLGHLAVRLNAFWVNHGGSYTGARDHQLGRPYNARIVSASKDSYCIVVQWEKITLVKKGPTQPLRSSSHHGAVACSQPAGPAIRLPSDEPLVSSLPFVAVA